MSKKEIDLSFYDDQKVIPESNVKKLTDGCCHNGNVWVKDNFLSEEVTTKNKGKLLYFDRLSKENRFDNLDKKTLVLIATMKGNERIKDIKVIVD
ncbi:MAG: hypothetical protein WC895_03560 [Candidatus Shapirobacteria bacterium]|jgi:hypothetical protein